MANNSALIELVNRVFTVRNNSHLSHWKTTSYAQHMALGDFYDSIVDSIDNIVECYQGNFGLVDITLKNITVDKDILNHIKTDAAWIANNRERIANRVASLENLIDGLTEIYLKTIYKLTNLH